MFDPEDPLLIWGSLTDAQHELVSVSTLSVLMQVATVSTERTPHGRERRERESKNFIFQRVVCCFGFG